MIIGLTGSFAAGKGEVVKYLVEQKGFRHYSAREFIIEEIKRRGLSVDRDSMTTVANDLRAQNSPSYITESLFKRAQEEGGDSVVESLRALAEVCFIKEQGGVVLGVDADPKLRYARAFARGSESDHVSFGEWRQQEQNEMNLDEPTKQNIFGALEESDYVIDNSGTLEELHQQVDEVLAKISTQ